MGFYTRVSMVINKKNVFYLYDTIERLYEMGVRTVNIDWFNSAGRGQKLYNEFAIKETDILELEKFETAVYKILTNKKYSNFNISIDLPQWYENRNSFMVSDTQRTHYLECDAINNQISINEIGNVYPCFIFSNGKGELGNLNRSTLIEILNNKKKLKCPIGSYKHLFYQIKV